MCFEEMCTSRFWDPNQGNFTSNTYSCGHYCADAPSNEICGDAGDKDEDCVDGPDAGYDERGQRSKCDDDGDGYIDRGFLINSDGDRGNDCNDEDSSVYPGADEKCDTKDHDCDGSLSNNMEEPCTLDEGGTGRRLCQAPVFNPLTDSYWSDCIPI
jgi:hypothetical protein